MSKIFRRVTIFEFYGDGVTPAEKVDVMRNFNNLQRLSGEAYYDADGYLIVIDEVEEIADGLFTTKNGSVFTLEPSDDENDTPEGMVKSDE
jgi:hypothetical protein